MKITKIKLREIIREEIDQLTVIPIVENKKIHGIEIDYSKLTDLTYVNQVIKELYKFSTRGDVVTDKESHKRQAAIQALSNIRRVLKGEKSSMPKSKDRVYGVYNTLYGGSTNRLRGITYNAITRSFQTQYNK